MIVKVGVGVVVLVLAEVGHAAQKSTTLFYQNQKYYFIVIIKQDCYYSTGTRRSPARWTDCYTTIIVVIILDHQKKFNQYCCRQ